MMNRTTGCLRAVMAVAAGAGSDDDDQRSVVDVAREAGSFSPLVGALEATGLDEALAGEGPFTVFAPTDEAFARLPEGVLDSLDQETLSSILAYHVTSGRVAAETVVALETATTLADLDVSIAVREGTVILDRTVQVIQTVIEADNGIIHVIDAVLLPPSSPFPGTLVEAVLAYPMFDTLAGAVVTADLAGALSDENDEAGFTLFAPSNAAFAALGIDLASLSAEELANVLL